MYGLIIHRHVIDSTRRIKILLLLFLESDFVRIFNIRMLKLITDLK